MQGILVIFSQLLNAFWWNCQLFLLTLLVAIPLGLIISFGSMSKWQPFAFLEKLLVNRQGRWNKCLYRLTQIRPIAPITKTFVWVVRGIPLMLTVMIIFYAPGLLSGTTPWSTDMSGRFAAASVAFIINYACYFSEIFRGGIQGVPIGQTEAGQVLGMKKGQIFFKVTLLQVVKRILPPMGNEIMTLIKDTSIARIIALKEIIMQAYESVSRGLVWPLFATAIFFLAFVGGLTLLFGWLERKLDYFRA